MDDFGSSYCRNCLCVTDKKKSIRSESVLNELFCADNDGHTRYISVFILRRQQPFRTILPATLARHRRRSRSSVNHCITTGNTSYYCALRILYSRRHVDVNLHPEKDMLDSSLGRITRKLSCHKKKISSG